MIDHEIITTNEITSNQVPSEKYNLEERAAKFGETVIDFTRMIPETAITRPLISQLIKTATSVGVSYSEANDAIARKDFVYKLSLCRRESKESKHHLRMIIRAVPSLVQPARKVSVEAQKLNLIFSSIIDKSKSETQQPNFNDE